MTGQVTPGALSRAAAYDDPRVVAADLIDFNRDQIDHLDRVVAWLTEVADRIAEARDVTPPA